MKLISLTLLLALALSACDEEEPSDGDADADIDADADAEMDADEIGADADFDSDEEGPVDWPPVEIPLSTVPEPGVRRDIILVAGASAPPNPTTGAETPSELNQTQLLRYRQDADPPVPARAIVVAMPGFLSGGAAYDALARALVKRGATSGEAIEFWAIDRRSNLHEDLRGMNAAEALGDAAAAQGYYFGDDTVGGVAFEGFSSQEQLLYVSEWGLAVHVEDLRAVVGLVPEELRRGHVFLLGHSLGAAFAEAYASWRFEDGGRAVEDLAGVILIDGALGDEPMTETEYVDGSGSGLFASPGVTTMRQEAAVTELPFLGLEVYARAEILALRMLFDPEGIVDDRGRDEQLSLLMDLTLPNIPAMTNRAALGFAFDTQSQPLSFVRTSLGEATGGSVETYTSLLFGTEIVRPSDPSATYDWIDALDMDPPEYTPMEQFAHCLVDGQTNFMEWYFPSRLPLDIGAIGGPDVPDGGWQASFGLRTFDRELIDAPVLAIPGVLTGSDGYDSLTTRLAPTVGDGRRHAGVARDDASGLGLRVVDATALSHVDTMTGADLPFNPTPGAIETFLLEHVAESGTVDLPAMM